MFWLFAITIVLLTIQTGLSVKSKEPSAKSLPIATCSTLSARTVDGQISTHSGSEASRFLSRNSTIIILMQGLPYDCREAQIWDFFAEGENGCTVLNGGVMFVNNSDGRPSGDAFVMFDDEEAGQKALKKHKQKIGTRYIELFRSTQAEVQQVVNRNLDTSSQRLVVQSNRKDCIWLRGLPYEAHVKNIIEFLGETSRNIVFQGLHMINNAQRHPTGEAFIQMNSEISAASAAALTNNQWMQVGHNLHHIKVFQVSLENIHLVLAKALAPPQPILPSQPIVTQPVQNVVRQSVPQFSPVYPPFSNQPVGPPQLQPGLVLVQGLCSYITPQIIFDYFRLFLEIAVESVEMLRWGNAQFGGEALVRFRSPIDAERALQQHFWHSKLYQHSKLQ